MNKKILIPIMAVALMVTAGVNYKTISNIDSNLTDISLNSLMKNANATCENSVSTSGKISTTTLCNRKTSVADALLGIKCGTESTSSCSYSNI